MRRIAGAQYEADRELLPITAEHRYRPLLQQTGEAFLPFEAAWKRQLFRVMIFRYVIRNIYAILGSVYEQGSICL